MSEPDPLHPRFGEVWQHSDEPAVMVIGHMASEGWTALTIEPTISFSAGYMDEWMFDQKCASHWTRLEETWD